MVLAPSCSMAAEAVATRRWTGRMYCRSAWGSSLMRSIDGTAEAMPASTRLAAAFHEASTAVACGDRAAPSTVALEN